MLRPDWRGVWKIRYSHAVMKKAGQIGWDLLICLWSLSSAHAGGAKHVFRMGTPGGPAAWTWHRPFECRRLFVILMAGVIASGLVPLVPVLFVQMIYDNRPVRVKEHTP